MDSQFVNRIAQSHRRLANFPVCEVDIWVNKLTRILFPRSINDQLRSNDEIVKGLQELRKKLSRLISAIIMNAHKSFADQVAEIFFKKLPQLYQTLIADAQIIMSKNKIFKSQEAVFKYFSGFLALSYYRIARQLHSLKVTIIPNLITEAAFMATNIDLDHEAHIGLGVIIHSGSSIRGSKVVVEDNTIIGQTVDINSENSQTFHNKFSKQIMPSHSQKIPRPIVKSIHQLIGNTPLIEIKSIFRNPKVKIYAKLEGDNPGGSVKDRAAYYMINQAFKRGDLKPGMTIIEPTSGNTGIALAMVSRLFGVGLQLVMPENLPVQRTKTMEAYGAKVILTPASKSVQYSRDYARQKSKQKGYYMLDQFSNPDNCLAHQKTTGPQVFRDTEGKVTHFICGMGTTGTAMGVSKYLKKKDKNIKIIGVQPAPGSGVPGIKKWSKQYLPSIYQANRMDDIIDISGQDSVMMTRRLAKEEGIFAGMSSGTAMCAAVQVAKKLDKGVVVVIICDRGDRYLSIPLFG